MPKWEEYKKEAKSRGALAMELYVVRSTPGTDIDLIKTTLPEHLAYQKQMEAGGNLFLAGPISDVTGELMQAEGMIIYRASSLDEARKIAENDPMHQKGARSFEVRKWLVNEGNLSFTISLSEQSVEIKQF